MNARPWFAIAFGVAGAALLREGGGAWTVALAAGLAGAAFAGWRTHRGACAGFGLLLAAADLSWRGFGGATTTLLLPLGLLELLGPITLVLAAFAAQPPKLSRRLLGAWLASSGLAMFGLAQCASPATSRTGSVLIAGALAYRLGVVPAFAWAPLLLRHASSRVAFSGAVAFAASLAALVVVLPRLPDPAAAHTTVLVLSGATAPWALWHIARQWRVDRRCARSYSAVFAAAALLLTR